MPAPEFFGGRGGGPERDGRSVGTGVAGAERAVGIGAIATLEARGDRPHRRRRRRLRRGRRIGVWVGQGHQDHAQRR